MKVKVNWDFGDTELEKLSYAEALESSDLPDFVTIPEQVVEEWQGNGDFIISDWLSDEFGWTHFGWEHDRLMSEDSNGGHSGPVQKRD